MNKKTKQRIIIIIIVYLFMCYQRGLLFGLLHFWYGLPEFGRVMCSEI